MIKKLVCFALTTALMATIVCVPATVSATEAVSAKLETKPGTYYTYLNEIGAQETVKPNENISINATLFAESSGLGKECVLNKDAVILENTGDKLVFDAAINQSGFYNISINYAAIAANGSDIEYTLEIDGKTEFDGMKKLTLPRVYEIAEGDFPKDNRGNELRPNQTEVQMYREYVIEDAEGVVEKPYEFYLTEGSHSFSITLQREKVAITEIRIFNDAELPNYTEPADLKANNAEPIIVEAEHAKYTTSSMLYPLSVMNDSNTTPSDPSLVRLNTIGGENWVYPSQSLIWEFDVQTAGYYSLGFRYRQDINSGMSSHRRIKIDGQYLFSEMNDVAFPYTRSWKRIGLGQDEPYYVYLDKGTHTIEMSVTTGDMAKLISSVDDVVYKLSEMYRKIIMITGTSPDIYRDYYLDEMIPDLMSNMKLISAALKNCEEQFIEKTGVKGGETATLAQIYYQLDDFVESPHSIPSRLSTFETNISSLATWVMDNREQPLEIDKIYVYA